MESKIMNASLFKTLFSKSIHAGCLTDAEFNLIDFNTAFLGMLQLGSDIEGKSLWVVLTSTGLNPADLPKLNQLKKKLHSEELVSGKLRINTSNGRRLKIDFTGHSLEHCDDFKYYFEFTNLTSEIEAKKALRATMSSLQLATDLSNLGIFDYDFRKEKWLLNPRIYEILGITMSSNNDTENTINRIIHPEDFPMLLSEWIDKKVNGGKLDINFRIIHPKEGVKYVKCIGECLNDTNGQPWRFVGTIQDISEQIIQEKYLKKDRKLLQSIADSQNRFIIRISKDGEILFANRPFLQSTGINKDNLTIHNISSFLSIEDTTVLLGLVQKKINDWTVDTITTRLQKPNQETILVEWEIMSISFSKGLRSEIQMIGKDITLESELNKEIEQAYGNIRSLINNFSKVSIWSIDRELKLIAFNDYFSKEYEQFWGKPILPGDAIYANTNADEEANKFWRAQFSRALSGERFVLEYEIADQYFEVSFNPIEVNSEITGVACYGMNVTSTKQSERKLKMSEERWKFAVEGNKNGIWDWDVVKDELFFSESCYSMLGYSKNDYLHKEVNAWSAEIHADDLGHVGQTAGKMQTGEIDSFHVEMRFKCNDGSYKWILNRGKTFKRDEEGKPMRILGLWSDITKQKSDEAKIKEYVSSLEKFATLTSHELRHPVAKIMGISSQLKDHGLNETEVNQLLHNLAITAEELDSVIIEMSESVATEKQKIEPKDMSKIQVLENHQTIWFIDDDVINNLLNERLLKKHFPAIVCKTFSDAEKAFDELNSNSEKLPDAIFLDINMPVMNGWDFLDNMHSKNLSLIVYMLTSSIDPKDQEKAMAYSAVKDFISKPLKEERLRNIIG
jgi:PAS domain S-box-containing protein